MANEKAEAIITELVEYSVLIIKLADDPRVPKPVASQLIRSSSSIGANFCEAQDAASKKDFVNKIYIAKKEANETKYWLRIAQQLVEVDDDIIDRAQKYLMMLQKIINSTKEPKAKS
jgi:four helix bundle protein